MWQTFSASGKPPGGKPRGKSEQGREGKRVESKRDRGCLSLVSVCTIDQIEVLCPRNLLGIRTVPCYSSRFYGSSFSYKNRQITKPVFIHTFSQVSGMNARVFFVLLRIFTSRHVCGSLSSQKGRNQNGGALAPSHLFRKTATGTSKPCLFHPGFLRITLF